MVDSAASAHNLTTFDFVHQLHKCHAGHIGHSWSPFGDLSHLLEKHTLADLVNRPSFKPTVEFSDERISIRELIHTNEPVSNGVQLPVALGASEGWSRTEAAFR